MTRSVFFILALTLAAAMQAAAQENGALDKGEELFTQNKPEAALPFLEAAVKEEPLRVKAFLYLGIAYTQLGRLDEAIAVYRKVLPRAGTETARVAFNLGNAYYSKGSMDFARQCYGQAIAADSTYAPAYLNRANAAVQAGALAEAILDYENYLSLEPRSPKREPIEQLCALIRAEQAERERRAREAAEAARAEAARKQQVLDEVSASLQAAAEDSSGVSSGSEGVEGYEGEFELE